MKKALTLLMLTAIISFCVFAYSEMLVIEFTLKQAGSAELTALNVYEGHESDILSESGEYIVLLLDASGNEIYKKYFTPQFTAWADAINPSKAFPVMPGQEIGDQGQIDRSEIQVVLRVPMLDNAARVQIIKGTQVLIDKEIDLCNNNGVCEPTYGENYLTCADCSSGSEDGYCDGIFDNKCDPDCIQQGRDEMDTDCTCGNGICDVREDSFYCPQDCGKPANPLMKWGLMAIIVLVIIIALLVWIVKNRKSNKKSKKKENK
jgi:hypothetical protein